jgi:sec-independent protein translocase protein TatB
MFNLDPAKLVIIAVVAVILLGPDRLPHVARQVGGYWRAFNDYRHRMESHVRESMPDLPSSAEITRLARSPSALLDHLSAMGTDKDDEAPASPPPAADTPAVLHTVARPTAGRAESSSPEPATPGDPGLN